jgi:hypothetical protein
VEAAEAEIQKVSEYHDWDGTALEILGAANGDEDGQ